METQQRFEGDSVEQVLAEVRAALGADAEILEANKVRSGGLGGFFAKETFEVIARPRQSARAAARSALPPGIDEAAFDRAAAHVSAARGGKDGTVGLMDLAEQVSDAEGRHAASAAPAATPPTPAAPPAAAAPPATSPAAPPAATLPAAPVIRPSMPTANPLPRSPQPAPSAFEPMGVEAMPRLSTEGGAFNEVLHRIATDAGPEIAAAVDRRMGHPTGADLTQRPLKPVGPLARSRAQVVAEQVPHGQAPTQAPASDRDQAAIATPTMHPDTAVESAPAALPPIADLIQPAGEMAVDRTTRLLSWLQRDNLPRTTVLTALRGLPEVPALPDTSGVVVVVVGRRQEALKLCRRLAKAHDAGPEQIVLASASYKGRSIPEERRIIDLTDAARDRGSWRRRTRPTFVAVETPPGIGAGTLTWTREIVAELEAHQVIGVVSADRKTEDVAAWAERVGGLDALALTGVEETTTPYAVLALEIPVGWLDDQTATPGSWAHVLLEGSR